MLRREEEKGKGEFRELSTKFWEPTECVTREEVYMRWQSGPCVVPEDLLGV